MNVLVAGGAGYIGSHTCVALLEAGMDVIVVDSLANSQSTSIDAIARISSRKPVFIEADVRDKQVLERIFDRHRIDAVINFAGLKAVGDSVSRPLDYYENNMNCALSLAQAMSQAGVGLLVFSSSAAVYGEPRELPITEQALPVPQNPYGRSKLFIEEVLKDLYDSGPGWKIALLRYFNPVGAHPSALIGESPNDSPSNLMPIITRVAAGQMRQLNIYGGDYDTEDGTAVRDYIHVMDLAQGHVKALQKLQASKTAGILTANLCSGQGYSVLEMVRNFEKVCGVQLPYQIVDRRPGDVARCYADPALAKREISWQTQLGITDMCRDAWNWQQKLLAG